MPERVREDIKKARMMSGGMKETIMKERVKKYGWKKSKADLICADERLNRDIRQIQQKSKDSQKRNSSEKMRWCVRWFYQRG